MSALGQKQTFAVQNVMSALPSIADICSATRDVRFVPIADIEQDRAEVSSIQFLALISYGIEKRSGLTIEKLDIRRQSAAG